MQDDEENEYAFHIDVVVVHLVPVVVDLHCHVVGAMIDGRCLVYYWYYWYWK